MNKKVLSIVAIIIVVLLGSYTFINMNKGKADKEVVGETIKVTHRQGETEVKKNPKRVAVLDFGSIDTLDKFGVDVIALPKKGLPSYLEKYKDDKYIDLGSLKEFSMEKLNEAKPDLIIIEGRQAEYYDELSKIAPTILLGSDGTKYFESLKSNVTNLGMIFGKEDLAEKSIKDIDSKLEKVQKKNGGSTALVLMVSDGSMSVFAEGSRFASIYSDFGFKSADSNIEVSNHGQDISYEYLLSHNTDYLFVIDRGAVTGSDSASAKDIVENDVVKNTDVYKKGNIVYLNPEAWYLGSGLMSTDIMIKEIEEAIK